MNTIDLGWQPLGTHTSYRHLAVTPSAGPLAHLAPRGMAIGVRSGFLLALALHESIPTRTMGDLHVHILEIAETGGDLETRMRFVQEEVWRLHETGAFYRCVPEIMAVCAAGSSLVAWRAGPNGLAVADLARIRLVGEDYRYAALRRLGVDITSLRPEELAFEPLTDEVSGLTQLQPTEAVKHIRHLGEGEVEVLLSRGALPFGPLEEIVDAHEWWALDSGWRRGMAADVIVVAPDDRRSLSNFIIDSFDHAYP